MRVAPVLLAIGLAIVLHPGTAATSATDLSSPDPILPHLMPPAPPHAWPRGVVQGAPLPPASPAQTSGVARLVVLLVEFTDIVHDPAHDAAYVSNGFNAAGPNATSMRAYYEEVSLGALTVQATVVPTWWQSARTMASYGDDGAGIDSNPNGSIYELVAETVRLADPSVDFSAFDADGNDIVDHLVVVHAGGAQEEEPEDVTRIWSHQWYVPSLSADGELISAYIMVGEASPVGVLAHEFAHDLAGMPDLYDLDESSEGGVGRWDLMAQGAWNGFPYGTSPAHLSAWSRMRLGWTSPTDAATSDVLFPAVETSGFVLRLPIPGSILESFLVENRQPIGFDAALPGSGLLIWHVDETRGTNNDDARRRVDLEEADEDPWGDRPLDPQDPWSDTSWGFGPETVPGSASNLGTATGWRIRDISGSGRNMTARVFRAIPRDIGVMAIRLPGLAAPNTTVDAEVVLVNEGPSPEAANVTLRVYRERFEPGALLLERRASESLPSLAAAAVSFAFPVGAPGRYLVHASTDPGGDVSGNDDRLAHVLVVPLYFRDTMEFGSGSWTTDGLPADPHRWILVNEAFENASAHSPRSAWRFGLEEVPLPSPSPSPWHSLTSVPVLVPGGPLHLIFYHRYALWNRTDRGPAGPGESDEALVEVRSGSGAWTVVARYAGRDLTWRGVSLNLSANVSGPALLQVRFNVSSAWMPNRGGWWIDDVSITGGGLGRGLVLTASPTRFDLRPGSVASAVARLANVGDHEETIDLGVALPESWIASLVVPGGFATIGAEPIRLGPDRDTVLRLEVSVPQGAAGSSSVSIEVRSSANPLVRANVTLEIVVEPAPTATPWAFVGGIAVAVASLALIGVLLFRRRRSRT